MDFLEIVKNLHIQAQSQSKKVGDILEKVVEKILSHHGKMILPYFVEYLPANQIESTSRCQFLMGVSLRGNTGATFGIDGIIITQEKEKQTFHPVQIKFTIDRLTTNLETFYQECHRLCQTWGTSYGRPFLITTAREVSRRHREDCHVWDFAVLEDIFTQFPQLLENFKVKEEAEMLEQNVDFLCCRLEHKKSLPLERNLIFQPVDLGPKNSPALKEKDDYSLSPCQEEIVAEARLNLEKDGKCLLHLPPGYGKTRLAFHLCANSRTVLFLLPQRPLLEQQLNTWRSYLEGVFILPVCSELAVKERFVRETTSPKEISYWIDLAAERGERLFIFSTYHSVKKIREARPEFSPDIIIYDEAHRIFRQENREETAEKSQSWEWVAEMNSVRKLFLSATPYSGRHNPNVIFGNAVRRTFLQAIISERLSDFRFYCMNGVGNRQKTPSRIKGQLLSISREQSGWRRMMAFCSRHDSLQEFAKILREEMPGVQVLSDKENSSMAERRTLLDEFRSSELPVVLLSVRVFLEGIDVPECDAACFLTPSASSRVIVQGVGRALRYQRGKRAQIIIPSVLDDELTPADEDYATLMDILKAIDIGDPVELRERVEVEFYESEGRAMRGLSGREKIRQEEWIEEVVGRTVEREGTEYAKTRRLLQRYGVRTIKEYQKFRRFYLQDVEDKESSLSDRDRDRGAEREVLIPDRGAEREVLIPDRGAEREVLIPDRGAERELTVPEDPEDYYNGRGNIGTWSGWNHFLSWKGRIVTGVLLLKIKKFLRDKNVRIGRLKFEKFAELYDELAQENLEIPPDPHDALSLTMNYFFQEAVKD